ncbi:MAG: response regulator [Burkholderiales bacterium]|nr:response regulator [Burkholderiales bacterium]
MTKQPDNVITIAFGQSRTSDFAPMKALIIDDNASSRMTLSSVLRDIGITRIKMAPTTHQAKLLLQSAVYDVILCEYHFLGRETGQDLLDDIRHTRIVPFRTVFFMVTGEATYERVSEVVENAPDDYLLKPFKPLSLEMRLHKALAKKRSLLPIHTRMEYKDFEGALALCREMINDGGTYWLDAARIGAELAMHLKRHRLAQQFYDMVLKAKALPWAKLGIAHLAVAGNDNAKARGTLEALVSDANAFADAYDLLARVHFEDGALTQALQVLRRGVEATPANLMRLQKLGSLAFFVGDAEESESMLMKAFRLSVGSRTFDSQTLLQLALLVTGRGGAAKDVDRFVVALENALARDPGSFRLTSMHEIAITCQSLVRKDTEQVLAQVARMEAWLGDAQFDFECACNFLSLLRRIGAQGILLPQAEGWVHRIASRHCISKTGSDLMVAALGELGALVEIVEKEHAHITFQTNDAMSKMLSGDANATAQRLIKLAKETLNARVFSLIDSLAVKHQDRLNDASHSLIQQAQELRKQYCSAGTQVSLARMNENSRPSKTLPLP